MRKPRQRRVPAGRRARIPGAPAYAASSGSPSSVSGSSRGHFRQKILEVVAWIRLEYVLWGPVTIGRFARWLVRRYRYAAAGIGAIWLAHTVAPVGWRAPPVSWPVNSFLLNRPADNTSPSRARPDDEPVVDKTGYTKVKPSFQCDAQSTPAAQTICQDSSLAELDRRLSGLYSQKIAGLAASEQEQLKEDELDWLKRRDKCVSMADPHSCIRKAYDWRLTWLNVMRTGGTNFVAFVAAPQWEERTWVGPFMLNVRQTPGGPIITTIVEGTPVNVVEVSITGWSKVEISNSSSATQQAIGGFVRSEFLASHAPATPVVSAPADAAVLIYLRCRPSGAA